MEVETASPRRWHASGGYLVQVRGTKARSECYGISVGSSENEKGELVDTMFGGRYLDELEKRNGECVSRNEPISRTGFTSSRMASRR